MMKAEDMSERVILGMSGGVDSSVSALLLQQQGYEVIGLFMKNWDEKDETGVCTATEDYIDVGRVAAQLDIPYYTVNFAQEYWDKVFEYFLKEYRAGRTPNPDVMCNTQIKFSAFLDYALKLEGSYIAMGHYAQVEKRGERYCLLRGEDKSKDQSYFLSRIDQKALARTIFPIGHLPKSEVRELAQKYELATANKKDSTGICFIGERDFDLFLDRYLLAKKGDLYSVEGKRLGEHSGLIHYTYGQRRGIGIGGVGTGEPWFVVGKSLKKNILYVAQGEEHEALYTRQLIAEDMLWISGEEPKLPIKCTAKFRYRQEDIPVTVQAGKRSGELVIVYDHPVKAVTPGQVAVLYDGEVCLGGAIIKTAQPLNGKYDFLYE